MVKKWTHGRDMEPWYRHGFMVQTWTHGIDNIFGIDLDSWYRISTPESPTYERTECCMHAGFYCMISSLCPE